MQCRKLCQEQKEQKLCDHAQTIQFCQRRQCRGNDASNDHIDGEEKKQCQKWVTNARYDSCDSFNVDCITENEADLDAKSRVYNYQKDNSSTDYRNKVAMFTGASKTLPQ